MKAGKLFFCVLSIILAACNKTEIVSPDPLPITQKPVEKAKIRAEYWLNNDTLRGNVIPGVIEGTGEYEVGSPFTVSVKANEGYALVRFFALENNQFQGKDRYSATVRGSYTFRAEFVDQWKVSVSSTAAPGSRVTGAGVYRHNTTCTLTATPGELYKFSGWKEGGKIFSTVNPYIFPVLRNHQIEAYFKRIYKPYSQYRDKKLSSDLPQPIKYVAYFRRDGSEYSRPYSYGYSHRAGGVRRTTSTRRAREEKRRRAAEAAKADGIEPSDEFTISLVFAKEETLGAPMPEMKLQNKARYTMVKVEAYVGDALITTLKEDERTVKDEFQFTYDGERYVVIGIPDKNDFFPKTN